MQYMFYSHTVSSVHGNDNWQYGILPHLHHLEALQIYICSLKYNQHGMSFVYRTRLNSNLFRLLQGVTECDGQELSSLPSPSSSSSSQMNLVEATSTLLSSLTRLRSHFFFMRLDYQLAQGFPCLPTGSVAALTRKYKR